MSEFAHTARTNLADAEKAEYRAYYALIWPFAVAVAVLGRIFPGRTKSSGKPHSVLAEANDLVGRALPWVFSGR